LAAVGGLSKLRRNVMGAGRRRDSMSSLESISSEISAQDASRFTNDIKEN